MSNIKEIMSKAGGALVHLLQLIVAPMKNYGAFFVFMYILGAVCTWATIPNYYGAHPYEWALLELVGDVYVLCAVLALLPRRVGLWLRGLSMCCSMHSPLLTYSVLYSLRPR